MVRAVGAIHEVAVQRVQARIEPIIRHADVETTDRVAERQVKLLRVGRIGNADRAPGRQAQALPVQAERRLERHAAQVQATPDVAAEEISADGGFQLVLCLGRSQGSQRQDNSREYGKYLFHKAIHFDS